MSKKKGLSLEEKRRRMLDMFYEKMDFFNLKEVEKIASKEKGITSMAIKDVLQSLVDDGMVDTDRIGTSNYYWAFPSKGLQVRKRKVEEYETELTNVKKKTKEVKALIEEASKGREETEERASLAAEAAELQSKHEEFATELLKFKECDPDVVDAKREKAKVCATAANRWTDNVFSMKSWVKNRFNMEDAQIDASFDIPADFDYISV